MKDFFTKYRGWIIFLVVVPISFIYRGLQRLDKWFYQAFVSSPGKHDARVKSIASQVRQGYEAGAKMCTARAPWKTMSIRNATYKDDLLQIPINLRSILSLDRDKLVLRVEPMVTMAEVTRYLNPKGYALAVQVEMDDLTVGGLCMGIGIETTSHSEGFLFETVKSYEIVTADGEVLAVTSEEYPDLFHVLPMSHGTLGFLTAVELTVVPIKKYMRLQYEPYYDRSSFCRAVMEASGKSADSYVEALAFEDGKGVLMTGELVESAPSDGKINPVNSWYKPWFYTHVEDVLESGRRVEYIPVRHYFHRHTPSMFFQLRDLIPFGNSAWYRWFFGWMGAPKVALMKYTITKELRRRSMHNRVAQDVLIPIVDMEEALALTDRDYRIYPLWICPVKLNRSNDYQGLIRVAPGDTPSALYVDIGIYGIPPAVREGTWKSIETARRLEEFVRNKTGFSMLYADIFMNRHEFEEMFDHELYRKVRVRYSADKAFPEVYDKITPEKWLIDIDAEVPVEQLQSS